MSIFDARPTSFETLTKGDVLKLVSHQYSTSVRYVMVAEAEWNANGDCLGYDCWVLKPSRYSAVSEVSREFVSLEDFENEWQATDQAELLFRWYQARSAARIAVMEAEVALLRAKQADDSFATLADEVWTIL